MRDTSTAHTAPATVRRAFAWLTAALWVYVSWEALSSNPGVSAIGQIDKVLHFGAFVGLAATSALALVPSRRSSLQLVMAWLLYGALIEVLQSFIPGRDPSWLDLLADAAGIAAGLALAHLLRLLPALKRAA